jgi:hypothetical protein
MSNPLLDLGPCQVLYNSVNLGKTFGGVKFRDEVKSKDILTDQDGETPVDGVLTGRLVEAQIPLTQTSLAILGDVIPGAVDGAANLKVSNVVGGAMYANAKKLVLKPLVDQTPGAEATWLTVHKAYPISKVEIGYDNSGQRVFNVTFKAFPDQTSGQVGELWRVGAAS